MAEVVVELGKAAGTISDLDESTAVKVFVFLMFGAMILIVKTMR